MYELVSVKFPFADKENKGKPRPGFVISPAFGKHQQVIVAYITSKLDEQLETDILLDPSERYFLTTGLLQKSLIKLHRLGTFQPIALKEGQGSLPDKLIPQLKKKLIKVFQLK
ncbi:MAG: type II toxin-antitoxin system PemK/MazF family toxin [Candidatus Levybacteria bacterium]|nr:type II toxin-antitoxin system PemK/MazF family toxin [Candidatus Levybacteria bacterium]